MLEEKTLTGARLKFIILLMNKTSLKNLSRLKMPLLRKEIMIGNMGMFTIMFINLVGEMDLFPVLEKSKLFLFLIVLKFMCLIMLNINMKLMQTMSIQVLATVQMVSRSQ